MKGIRSAEQLISHEELQRVMHYDPDTGQFTRLVRLPRAQKAHLGPGSIAGRKDKQGYWVVEILRIDYKAHRLAVFYMTGRWPIEVDHINRIKTDNRWCNLREVTRSQNQQNRKVSSKSKSGFIGVWFSRGSYKAVITVSPLPRKRLHLGSFKTPEEAYEAYLNAKRKYHLHAPNIASSSAE